jgi:excisionase family DNA binding protein
MEVEQGQVFPRLLTVEDVAKILCVPLSTVHHWAVRGEGPPSFKVGKHRRFDAALVAAWLDRQKREIA